MYVTTWTTLTLDGETSTLDVQHERDLDAIVYYNHVLMGIAPMPVQLPAAGYLHTEATLDGRIVNTQWHRITDDQFAPITEDQLLEQLTDQLVDEITTALQGNP